MRRLELDPTAVDEIAEAAEWYAEQRKGLDRRFLDEIERQLPSLRSSPRSFPREPGTSHDLEIRRALLKRFPYSLIFLVTQDEIRVLAVAHTRRRPRYWMDRVGHQ